MSYKYIALDTARYLKMLCEVSANYAALHNAGKVKGVPKKHRDYLKVHPLVPFTMDTAWRWLVLTVEQAVGARLMYERRNYETRILQNLFDDPGLKHSDATSFYVDDFHTVTEIDAVVMDINNMIDPHVEFNCWTQWTVTTCGNTIALVSDRDYRVVQWERLTQYKGADHHVLELDLSNIVSYLRSQLNRTLKQVAVTVAGENYQVNAGNLIDFKPILREAITHLYPKISFPNELQLNGLGVEVGEVFQPINVDFSRLSLAGITDYAMFRDKFIVPVVRNFGFVHMTSRLDDTDNYIATLDERNVLTLDFADATQWRIPSSEDSKLIELAESYTNGDYLPPADRRRAEEYILSRREDLYEN